MANPFVHLELATKDVAKAKEFYGKLFGWSFQDHDMGEGMVYSMFQPDNGPGGGVFSMPGAPTAWTAYVSVDDIARSTSEAKSLGAQVLRDVTEVPGKGWMSILIDPTGATIALWKSLDA